MGDIRIITQALEEELARKDELIEILKETIEQKNIKIRHLKNRYQEEKKMFAEIMSEIRYWFLLMVILFFGLAWCQPPTTKVRWLVTN